MTPAKILIVEDDLIVARDIEQQLSTIGHVVVGVTSRGEDAVQLALNTLPDLVLMDIRLEGEMDGIEAAQRIRDRVRVPVVYLTAYADDQTLHRARITEPFGYILKPFEDSQLRTAIEMALYKHSAEKKLKESERRYAVTLASIGDAVIATDEQARITFMNSVAEALTGFSQREANGLPLSEVFRVISEETGQKAEDPATKVLRLGSVVGLANHTVLRTRDGREIAIDDSGSPIVDDSGAIIGVVLVFRDVTQRRLAERAAALLQANTRLELALRRSNIGVWEMSPSPADRLGARGRYSNLWEQLGYDEAERFLDIDVSLASVHEEDRSRVESAMRSYFSGETPYLDVECRVERDDGSFRWLLARGATEYDAQGKAVRFLGSSVDITDRKQAELALLTSERLFRTFVDHALDAFYLHDEHGVILDMNRRACETLGYTRDELLGQTPLLYSVRTPEQVAETLSWKTDEEVVTLESRHIRKDGTSLPVEIRLRRFLQDGKIFLVAMVRDTSERIRAEQALRESEERFRGTFDNAGVGIAHCDFDGRYLRVNQKLCDILGYSREELLQTNVRATIHPSQDLTETLANIAALEKGDISSYSVDRRMLSKSGELVWGNVTVSRQTYVSGSPTHTIAVTQDISERKRLQAELRDAKDAAEGANRAKDEFLANVSHEIRTPMNAILGMTELALDTQLNDNQRQSLKTVKSAAESLMGIIDDLLDFSKIAAGKLQLDVAEFRLRSTVGDILRALATRAHRKGLELVCTIQPDVPDALVGDAGRLRQILINLVGNAIKFTTEGEVVVSVSVESGQLEAATLRFAIRDTGIGISKDKQATIFEAFEQEDTSTTRKYGGTGLGLTIASRLVALMGGQITVVSERERGSLFAFTASFGLQAQPFPLGNAEAPVLLRNMKVLIVDDNTVNRHILKEWLRGWRMDPTSVGDGLAAMDALWHAVNSGRPYPLVLLDARMPDTDGLTLAAKIRERAELSATRIILLTSGDRPGDLERFRELRVNAHLLKPVPEGELLDTIYAVMSREDLDTPTPRLAELALRASLPSEPPAPTLRVLVAEDNDFNGQLLRQLLLRRGH
ncbi:MAG TPA: PAS domain S-box protein, partial [Polyangiaceae bacterium]|nr:PAS domain S-box protein [Polyangiaceae bacterium]